MIQKQRAKLYNIVNFLTIYFGAALIVKTDTLIYKVQNLSKISFCCIRTREYVLRKYNSRLLSAVYMLNMVCEKIAHWGNGVFSALIFKIYRLVASVDAHHNLSAAVISDNGNGVV